LYRCYALQKVVTDTRDRYCPVPHAVFVVSSIVMSKVAFDPSRRKHHVISNDDVCTPPRHNTVRQWNAARVKSLSERIDSQLKHRSVPLASAPPLVLSSSEFHHHSKRNAAQPLCSAATATRAPLSRPPLARSPQVPSEPPYVSYDDSDDEIDRLIDNVARLGSAAFD
jgi:hypothetical protein